MSWDFAAPARPMLDALLCGEPVTLGVLAASASQSLEDVAAVVTALVQGQAASVLGVVA
ncbi:hypothetical protein [Streptomyces sp. NPDC058045]|uniref:hypothetical protein n=1 Tax=Streptomyces sp. NPDC058045 TaxID=3346311 RepID=UPI0036F1501E